MTTNNNNKKQQNTTKVNTLKAVPYIKMKT